MVRNIGEIFEFSGKWYQVVEDDKDSCDGCVFKAARSLTCSEHREIIGHCSKRNRGDGTTVIIKEVKGPTIVAGTPIAAPNRRKVLLLIA